jgi:hypothetical protein
MGKLKKKPSTQALGRISRLSIKGVVKARKCKHCGHHEIGVVRKDGNFIALKPGDEVALRQD